MLIDFHTHIYPEKLASRTVETLGGKAHIPHFTDGTLGSLTALMDREGVDRFVLLHIATSPKNEGNVNAFARQTNSARHPSFGSVHPDSARWKEELLALKEAGVKGVKFHNEYQSFFADDEKAFPLYAECGRLGLAMLFHGGADLAFSPPESVRPRAWRAPQKRFPRQILFSRIWAECARRRRASNFWRPLPTYLRTPRFPRSTFRYRRGAK